MVHDQEKPQIELNGFLQQIGILKEMINSLIEVMIVKSVVSQSGEFYLEMTIQLLISLLIQQVTIKTH